MISEIHKILEGLWCHTKMNQILLTTVFARSNQRASQTIPAGAQYLGSRGGSATPWDFPGWIRLPQLDAEDNLIDAILISFDFRLPIRFKSNVDDLLNFSFRKGIFPGCLESANVIRFTKVNEPRKVCDFRPISIVSVVSAIFERIMLKKFIHPGSKYSVNASQFAYIPRSRRGTTCALINPRTYKKYIYRLRSMEVKLTSVAVQFLCWPQTPGCCSIGYIQMCSIVIKICNWNQTETYSLYFTVQTTSASTERLFSAFGNIFDKKRVRLQKKTSSAILFEHYNS